MQTPPAGSLPPRFGERDVNNTALRARGRLFEGQLSGVETPAVDADGTLGLVDSQGRAFIAKPLPDGGYGPLQLVANLSAGHALGAQFDGRGGLLVAHAPTGLLRLAPPGGGGGDGGSAWEVQVLASAVSAGSRLHPGERVVFAEDMDVARDGTIYWTSGTDIAPLRDPDGGYDVMGTTVMAFVKAAPAGLLMAYHPSNGSNEVLADGFWFANGVALAEDESMLLINDSLMAKIWRYWLKGPKAGTLDVLVDSLPGFPDGISRASDGNFWVAVVGGPPPIVAMSHLQVVRAIMAWVPKALRPKPQPFGLVLKVSPSGEVLESLGDPDGRELHTVTAAVETSGGQLLLGSLESHHLSLLDLSSLAA